MVQFKFFGIGPVKVDLTALISDIVCLKSYSRAVCCNRSISILCTVSQQHRDGESVPSYYYTRVTQAGRNSFACSLRIKSEMPLKRSFLTHSNKRFWTTTWEKPQNFTAKYFTQFLVAVQIDRSAVSKSVGNIIYDSLNICQCLKKYVATPCMHGVYSIQSYLLYL